MIRTADKTKTKSEDIYPVAIIGAGPIGLETAVTLKRLGVRYIQFDANQIGHTMTWWPRNTPFFSTTERLAIAGVPIQNNHQQRITGEDYLVYLRGVVEQFDLQINAYERVDELRPLEGESSQFELITSTRAGQHRYRAEKVILAIGDMHWAKRIEIPGEDLPHVSHYFNDPHDYFRQKLLIVGGKNSAAEAALRCWRAGAEVTISYRRESFDEQRIKHWLTPDLMAQIESDTIRFLPATVPVAITEQHVELKPADEDGRPIMSADSIYHETDFVLLNTGFHGDQSLLEMAGVTLTGDNRVPVYNEETMESNVPGLYLSGTVAAGIQQRYKIFIENSHDHAGKICQAITGQWPSGLGNIPSKNYELSFEQIQAN